MFDVRDAPLLKGLSGELDALAGLDPDALDDEALVAHFVASRRERDRLDALSARLGSAYRARRLWAAAGARSAAAHLASLTREPIEACRADLRLAKALATMPVTAAALSEGSLSRAHAERLRIAAGGARAAAFGEGEQMLVRMAQTLDGHEFTRVVRYWMQAADDDAAESEARRHDRDRSCVIDELLDGRVDVRATMTRTAGAEFATALGRITDELFETDWARARERLGREPIETELGRTAAQRRHDALVVMARRATAAAPDAKAPAPLISFVYGASDERFDRLCELANGTVVTAGEVAPYLGVADLERVVMGAPDGVRVSQRTRVFRGAERRAVELRDRYCTFPGCRVPAARCEVDHVIPYAEGGPTTQQNGRLRCAHHHRGRRRSQPWLAADPPGPAGDDTS